MPKHVTDLKQVSALIKKTISDPQYKTIADYGAGTGTAASEYAKKHKKTLLRYDPFLPEETNEQFYEGLHGADIVTCANVLNVIMDDKELTLAIEDLLAAINHSKGRTGAVSVYRAPKPSPTQRAKPNAWYVDQIREVGVGEFEVYQKAGIIWIHST